MLLLGLTACTNVIIETVENNNPEFVSDIRVIASDFQYDNTTRTDFIIDDSGAKFIWADNDTIGIFPDECDQIRFPMIAGAGTNSANFTGGGWALKSTSTYYAYFPFDHANFISWDKKNSIEVSYDGQLQNGVNSTKDLGRFDFMAASGVSSNNGALNFKFEHLGCLLKIDVTIPANGSYKELSLNIDEPLFTIDASLDLEKNPISLTSQSLSNTISLKLENITASADEVVSFYMMIPPVDLTGKEISISLICSNVNIYDYDFD